MGGTFRKIAGRSHFWGIFQMSKRLVSRGVRLLPVAVPENAGKLVTVEEAAKIAGISRASGYNRVNAGLWPAYNVNGVTMIPVVPIKQMR